MKLEKAIAVIRSMPNRTRYRRPPRTLTYQPLVSKRHWTWENATHHERACFVRANRQMGIMDWDLLGLFCLTREGLAAIAKGKDWHPSYTDPGQPLLRCDK